MTMFAQNASSKIAQQQLKASQYQQFKSLETQQQEEARQAVAIGARAGRPLGRRLLEYLDDKSSSLG